MEQYSLHPSNIFIITQTAFFKKIPGFQIKKSDISMKTEEEKIAAFEEKIKQKEEVIAKLTEDLMGIKKPA